MGEEHSLSEEVVDLVVPAISESWSQVSVSPAASGSSVMTVCMPVISSSAVRRPGEVDQLDVAAAATRQRADRGQSSPPGDELAFPVPDPNPLLDHKRAMVDQQGSWNEPRSPLVCSSPALT